MKHTKNKAIIALYCRLFYYAIIHGYNGIYVGPTLLENVKSKCLVTTTAYIVKTEVTHC